MKIEIQNLLDSVNWDVENILELWGQSVGEHRKPEETDLGGNTWKGKMNLEGGSLSWETPMWSNVVWNDLLTIHLEKVIL